MSPELLLTRLDAIAAALAAELPALVPGCENTPAAALAMLAALQRRGAPLTEAITARICALAT